VRAVFTARSAPPPADLLPWLLLALVVLAAAQVPPPDSQACPALLDRLRPTDTRLSAAVAQGCTRSPTFRARLLRIRELRGFVFVRWTPAEAIPRRAEAALLHLLRLLPDGERMVSVVCRRQPPGDRLIAVIGHEFQHVVELLESDAADPASIEALFRRLGRSRSDGTSREETDAALATEAAIRAELRQGR